MTKKKKSESTKAGKYVEKEMHEYRKSYGSFPKSKKQAVAVGLSKARQHGVKVPKKKSGG